MAQQKNRASVSQAEATVIDVAEAAYDLLTTDAISQIDRLAAIAAAYNGQSEIVGSFSNFGARDVVYQALLAAWGAYSPKMETALYEWGKASAIDTPYDVLSSRWWQWLRDYLSDEGAFSGGSVDRYVTPRGWTKGSEVTTGSLRVYRCNVDVRGHQIDSGRAQVTTFRAQSTQATGSATVQVLGEIGGDEPYEMLGLGLNTNIEPISSGGGTRGLTNDPYLTNADATVTTAGQNWYFDGAWTRTVTAAKLYLADQRTQRRQTVQGFEATASGASIARVCNIPGNDVALQSPLLPVVAVYPDGMGTGTVTVEWGDKSQTFGGLSDTTIQLLVPDRDSDLYPQNFDGTTDGRVIKVTKDTAAGTLTVSAVFWIPMTYYNNAFWACACGTTPFVAGDSVQVTDTLSEAASLNTLLARMYPTLPYAYLPNVGSNLIPNLS